MPCRNEIGEMPTLLGLVSLPVSTVCNASRILNKCPPPQLALCPVSCEYTCIGRGCGWGRGGGRRVRLDYHIPTRSLSSANINLLSVPRVRNTFASRGFSVVAPAVWNSPHLAFATLPLPISSVAFLKLTVSRRLSAPPSGSPNQVLQIRPLAN